VDAPRHRPEGTLSAIVDTSTVRHLPDVDHSQAPAEELLRRVFAIAERAAASAPDDHVSFSITHLRGHWFVRIVSGPERCHPDVQITGDDPSIRQALLHALELSFDEDEGDDRPTLVDAWVNEERALA